LTDRREYRAKVVGCRQAERHRGAQDRREEAARVLLGKSANANVGEWVVAIGSPFGFENPYRRGS
jgi:serine protease Do